MRTGCEEGHQPWPARGRYARHVSAGDVEDRQAAYDGDVAATSARAPARQPRLVVVNLDTGEIDDGSGGAAGDGRRP